MTAPIILEIMLHYYVGANDYRNGDHSAHSVREGLSMLVKEGMLSFTGENDLARENNPQYVVTDKGKIWVKALCKVPFPKYRWYIPNPKEKE